jgi:NitT/TauT family transport system substrate-binding protein
MIARFKAVIRKTLTFSAAFLFLIPIASCFGLERWTFGYSSIGEGMWPLLIAKEKGIFRKHGIPAAEFVFIEGGSRGVAALMGGDVQLMQMGGTAAVQAVLNGAPLLILSSITNVLFFDLVTSKEIVKPSDLKGKKIAISRFGSTTDLATRLLMNRWGISSKELILLQIGSNPARLVALLKGQIHGALLNSATHSLEAQQKGFRILASLPDMGIELLQSSIVATRALRKSEANFLERFFKSLLESIAWLKNEANRSEATYMLGRFIRSGNERILASTYELSRKVIRANPVATESGLRNILALVAQSTPGVADISAERFLDNGFLEQLDSSGYIKSLYER